MHIFLRTYILSFLVLVIANKTMAVNLISSNENSAGSQTLVTKEIIYEAPQSEAVHFTFYGGNITNENIALLNSHVKYFKNINYIAMESFEQGRFKVSMVMPKGSKLHYGFWTTKGKDGVYQDIWDWKKELMFFNDEDAVGFKANYNSKSEKAIESFLIAKGWMIFMLLSVVLIITFLVVKIKKRRLLKQDKIGETLILGFALYVFSLIARSEIIKLHPKVIFSDYTNFFKLLKASFSDFWFIIILTSVFIVLQVLFNKSKPLKIVVFRVFQAAVFFSAIYIFINILIVGLLGQPFNYEWLYYSDFLGSDDATNALNENLSWFMIVSVILLAISIFLLAKTIQLVLGVIGRKKRLVFAIALVGLQVVLLYRATKENFQYEKGKIESPVIAMVSSVLKDGNQSTFFNMNIKDIEVFNPKDTSSTNEDMIDYNKGHNITNVVFIVLESTGAKYLDDYQGNYNITPNISALAKQGLRFDNAYAHAPATMKSMVSLLGSMYPYISYKCLTQEKPDFEHPTISSLLKDKDYDTSFFTSADLSYLNGNAYLNYQGFDVVEDFSKINCNNTYKQEIYDKGNAIDDSCLSVRFTEWLDTVNEASFFSTLWTVQGHYPYFYNQQEEAFGVNNLYLNRYLNTIKNVDKLIGDVVNTLKEKALFDTTLIVITGDHGEAFGQHSNHGHASTIYEENMRIPLYFINPKLFNGMVKYDIASMKDISSTTMSILGYEMPDRWQGRDLLTTNFDESFFSVTFSEYLFGYRKGDKKYIFNETSKSVEVYDVRIDPHEKENLYKNTSKAEIDMARNRVASWVQYQDKFVNNNLLNQ